MSSLSQVNVETFVTVRQEQLLYTLNAISRLRRELALLDFSDTVHRGTTIHLSKGRGELVLERTDEALLLHYDTIRLGLRSHGNGHGINHNLAIPPEGPLSGHLALIKGMMNVCETFGRRALDLLASHDHSGPVPTGPFGEFEPGQRAALALASAMNKPISASPTLVCGTPWSRPTIFLTRKDQLSPISGIPTLGSKLSHPRRPAPIRANSPLLAAIQDWAPNTVIVSAQGTDDSMKLDIVPASYGMSEIPKDPIARMRLIESLPENIRKAAQGD